MPHFNNFLLNRVYLLLRHIYAINKPSTVFIFMYANGNVSFEEHVVTTNNNFAVGKRLAHDVVVTA